MPRARSNRFHVARVPRACGSLPAEPAPDNRVLVATGARPPRSDRGTRVNRSLSRISSSLKLTSPKQIPNTYIQWSERQSVDKSYLCSPAGLGQLRHVEEYLRRSVWLGDIRLRVADESDTMGDGFGNLSNCGVYPRLPRRPVPSLHSTPQGSRPQPPCRRPAGTRGAVFPWPSR